MDSMVLGLLTGTVFHDGSGNFIDPRKVYLQPQENVPVNKLDTKFYGEIRKAKDGSLVPDDQYVVFLAKDDAFAAVLPIYRDLCEAKDADIRHLAAVDSLIERVQMWRAMNPDQCKVPDVGPNEKLLPAEIAAAESMHDAGLRSEAGPTKQSVPRHDRETDAPLPGRETASGVAWSSGGGLGLKDADLWMPTHRHYKGGMYRQLGRVIYSGRNILTAGAEIDTIYGVALVTDPIHPSAVFVVYQNAKAETFARPAVMFDGNVSPGGDEAAGLRRFQPL